MASFGTPRAENTYWRPLLRLSPGLIIMSRRNGDKYITAPLYIHTFRPILAHTFIETERMAQTDPAALKTTADKLRYYRHLRGLEQKEVAAYVGLYRGTYAGYETPAARDYYPLDKLKPIADLFNVPLDYLLDDYNTFLCDGQGRQVRALRENMGLSRKEFADKLNIWPTTVRDWETDSVRMTRQTWEKLFQSTL